MKNSRGERWQPLFHTKRWLDSRWFIPIQQRVFISIIQVFGDWQHVDGRLFLTKVVPHFASGNGVICLFEINEGCVQPWWAPLPLLCCIFKMLQYKQRVQRASLCQDNTQIVCPGSCCFWDTSLGPCNVANWHIVCIVSHSPQSFYSSLGSLFAPSCE